MGLRKALKSHNIIVVSSKSHLKKNDVLKIKSVFFVGQKVTFNLND